MGVSEVLVSKGVGVGVGDLVAHIIFLHGSIKISGVVNIIKLQTTVQFLNRCTPTKDPI